MVATDTVMDMDIGGDRDRRVLHQKKKTRGNMMKKKRTTEVEVFSTKSIIKEEVPEALVLAQVHSHLVLRVWCPLLLLLIVPLAGTRGNRCSIWVVLLRRRYHQ